MLRRWTPFDTLDRDIPDVRRVFGEFGSALLGDQTRSWAPPLDLYTKDDTIFVRLELPGVDPADDVDIEVSDDVLTISGQRQREESTDNGEGWIRREIAQGSFTRSVALPGGVDPSKVRATYDAGILTVAVPLPQKPSSKVKVEIGGSTHKELSN